MLAERNVIIASSPLFLNFENRFITLILFTEFKTRVHRKRSDRKRRVWGGGVKPTHGYYARTWLCRVELLHWIFRPIRAPERDFRTARAQNSTTCAHRVSVVGSPYTVVSGRDGERGHKGPRDVFFARSTGGFFVETSRQSQTHAQLFSTGDGSGGRCRARKHNGRARARICNAITMRVEPFFPSVFQLLLTHTVPRPPHCAVRGAVRARARAFTQIRERRCQSRSPVTVCNTALLPLLLLWSPWLLLCVRRSRAYLSRGSPTSRLRARRPHAPDRRAPRTRPTARPRVWSSRAAYRGTAVAATYLPDNNNTRPIIDNSDNGRRVGPTSRCDFLRRRPGLAMCIVQELTLCSRSRL